MPDLIAPIILAAGGSNRLGRPKQLVEVDGVPLVRRAADLACSLACGPVYVVLGASADEIAPALAKCPVEIARNADWQTGMGSSIRVGVELADRAGADAVLIMLVDQHRLSADLLHQLIHKSQDTSSFVACSCYASTLAPPAVFKRELFPELRTLRGDRGAREILARLHAAGTLSAVQLSSSLGDLDTPDDLARLPGAS